MKESVALRVLGEIMGWDDKTARTEFAWLRLMSRMKYDGYRDFLAGVRFTESLADWLQQFERDERQATYAFIRKCLVYIGPTEMQHLVELVYPETVHHRLISTVADRLQVPPYKLFAQNNGVDQYQRLLRRTLFLGLSDGARIDGFRRANVGIISNEQVAVGTQLDPTKWNSLLSTLRKDSGDNSAQFEIIYLMDDFVGSGKTFLRREQSGKWSGKLFKFWSHIQDVRKSHFVQDLTICVHHYIGAHAASLSIAGQHAAASIELTDWFPKDSVHFSFGTILPEDLPINETRSPDFMSLVKKYYDNILETQHTEVSGTSDVRLGFGGCALPLVLEHNTPNNSIALLWADTKGGNDCHAMRPLFRRRQRHL